MICHAFPVVCHYYASLAQCKILASSTLSADKKFNKVITPNIYRTPALALTLFRKLYFLLIFLLFNEIIYLTKYAKVR